MILGIKPIVTEVKMPILKTCTKCRLILPLHEFGKDRAKKDGKASACRDCMKKTS